MSLRFLKEDKKVKKVNAMVVFGEGFARWEVSSRPTVAAERGSEARQEGSPRLQTAREITTIFPDILICSSEALGVADGPSPGKATQNSSEVHA